MQPHNKLLPQLLGPSTLLDSMDRRGVDGSEGARYFFLRKILQRIFSQAHQSHRCLPETVCWA